MQDTDEYPFIYIAALVRTGSTLLAEMLTQLPYSFVLDEPNFGNNVFTVHPAQRELLSEAQINTYRFARSHTLFATGFRLTGLLPDYMLRVVKHSYWPRLENAAMQVGVKEIHNQGWPRYKRYFPNMRVLVTGRDPRDIYLSIRGKYETYAMPGLPSPQEIADDLLKNFQHQAQIMAQSEHLRVRYEDLCRAASVFEAVKAYVRSPIPTMGAIGRLNLKQRNRADEVALHGTQVTDLRVQRWQSETNPERLECAMQVYRMMVEYCEFWDYPEAGI